MKVGRTLAGAGVGSQLTNVPGSLRSHILFGMPTQRTEMLGEGLSRASLDAVERRTLTSFVNRLREELGADLRAIWLYGSRARGERPDSESDVDLMVIADGGERRYGARVNDLKYDIAEAEGANPVYLSVFVHDLEWLRGRREIESFFIQEVDRDKIVLAGSGLE